LDFGTIRSVDDPVGGDTEFTDLRAAYEARARNREVGFALKNELHQVSLSGQVRFAPRRDSCAAANGVAIRSPANASDAPFDATFMQA
jgi:hypothetical protein